jgi:membrane protein
LLSVFPVLSALISLYALIANPGQLSDKLGNLALVLPPEAASLVSQRMVSLLSASSTKLGIGLVLSLAIALWSAMSETSMLMTSLTAAFAEEEDRGLVEFYARAMALAVGLMCFALVVALLFTLTPLLLRRWFPLGAWNETVVLLRWPLLAATAMAALALVYRFAPNWRRDRLRRLLSPGVAVAALLWIAGSAAFSLYTSHFSYDRTYGPLGSAVVLMLWFYLTGYAILVGAELDAAIERRAPQRSGIRTAATG